MAATSVTILDNVTCRDDFTEINSTCFPRCMGCDPCHNSPFMTPHNKKLQYHYAHACLCVYIYFYFNAEDYILFKILSAVYISTRIHSSTVQVSKTYDVYLQIILRSSDSISLILTGHLQQKHKLSIIVEHSHKHQQQQYRWIVYTHHKLLLFLQLV